MTSSPPVLSIVICTYNRADLLPHALQSLQRQTLNRKFYEIIIVDNNSTDKTRELSAKFIEQFPDIRYVLETQQGISHARNRGYQEALGKYIAYIDDDAKAVPTWAEQILQAFEEIVPTPIAVGGPCIPWYEASPPAWFTDDFERRWWGDTATFLQGKRAEFGFSGSNMAITKEALLRFGPFSTDESIMRRNLGQELGEEPELFYRIYHAQRSDQASLFWYNPTSIVYHWTPIRNTKISYRTRRSFKSGLTIALIKKTVPFSLAFVKTLGYLFSLPLKAAWEAIQSTNSWKTEWVKFLQHFYYTLGYLYRSILNTRRN